MTGKSTTAFMLGLCTLLTLATHSHAQTVSSRQVVAPMPDMDAGGQNVPPRTHVVSERANQIRLSAVLSQTLYGREGKRLGTIEGAFLEPTQNNLGLIVMSGGKAIPWNSVAFIAKPAPRLEVDLDAKDVKSASDKAELATYLDIKKDLIGRVARVKDGTEVGTVKDLIVTFTDGAIIGLGVADKAVIGSSVHIVPWKFVDAPKKGAKAVSLAIDKSQFDQEPVLTTKAPESTTMDSTGSVSTEGRTDLGSSVKSPDARRN